MKSTILFVFVNAILLTACGSENATIPAEDKPAANQSRTDSLGDDFKTDAAMYDAIIQARTAANGGNFGIVNVSRKEKTMAIEVCYSACEEKNFQVIWDGKMTKSYPSSINLVVSMKDPNGEITCERVFIQNILVNLSEDIDAEIDWDNTVLTVSNGSSSQDIVKNGFVSN